MAKKKIKARAGAAMHKAAGKGLAAYNRARAKAKAHHVAGEALGKYHKKKQAAKKRRTKKKGKKRAARKAKGAGKPFRTKVQLGRRKASVKCPPGSILVETGVARKDKSGHKHTTVMATCVRGRAVRR